MRNLIKPTILIACSFVALTGKGQNLPCGNYRIDTAAMAKVLQYEKTTAWKSTQAVNELVRVYFHVFNNNDGTNTAATTTQINSEFASLLTSYSADNVCFLFAGIQYYNSTVLNTLFNADSDPNGAALAPYQVPGCINIFYMRKINGNNTACNPPCGYGGIALGGIPGTFFLVATGNIGSGRTIGHEMGHCLGLLHTFETAYGLEKINGSNSSTTADLITDTKADPFAYNGQSCFSRTVNKCLYNGNCKDPNGSSNFSPPYNNLMAYWWANGCYPTPVATTGQFNRVNSFLNSTPALANCSSPSSLSQGAVAVSSGYFMKSAINTLTTSGTVSITGSAVATIGGGAVFLKPGFRAAPASGGVTIVTPKPCN